MKILLLTDGIFPYVVGGMQKHSSYLAKFLAIAGHDVTVAHCVPMGKPAPDTNAVKDMLGLNDAHMLRSVCISFPKAGWMPGHYLKESYLYSRQLFDIFKASLTQYDFIYAKGFSAWYLLQKKSRGMTLPAVGIKFHGYEMFQIAAGWRTRLEHWMLRGPVKWNTLHADVVFSYGGKITGLIRDLGVDAERIAEIPTGIEQAWLSNNIIPSRGPVRFVFVGRDERRKGMPELIEVLKSPGTANPFEFEFVGPVNASNRVNAPHIKYHGIVTGQ
ncbi:MAG: glycosyltransferase, partial [Flavobacteriales bacterium]|nr:glycosyltransferase [Flavobacteriales bacterium]